MRAMAQISLVLAGLAGPRPTRDVRREQVSALAVGLGCVLGGDSVATQNVYANRHWLHVGRIDAMSVTAQMVNLESSRNWAKKQFIRIAVGKHGFAPSTTETKVGVASLPRQFPAPDWGTFVDKCKKAFLRVSAGPAGLGANAIGVASAANAAVVHGAQARLPKWFFAPCNSAFHGSCSPRWTVPSIAQMKGNSSG